MPNVRKPKLTTSTALVPVAPPADAAFNAPAPTTTDAAKPDAGIAALTAYELRRETAIRNGVYPAAKLTPRDYDYIAHIAFTSIIVHGHPYGIVNVPQLHGAAKPAVANRQPQIRFGRNPSAGASDSGGLKRFRDFGHGSRDETPDGRITCGVYQPTEADFDSKNADVLNRCNNILRNVKRAEAFAARYPDIRHGHPSATAD